jgi:two-component sensor histidine kinase
MDQRYRDFNPEDIGNVSATQLSSYADTASTLTRVAGYPNDQKKVDSLIHYAEALRNYDQEMAQVYARMAYEIATERNWKFPRAISAYRLAVIKETKAKYSEEIEDAMVDANISKRIFDQTDQEDWKVWVYSLIGRLHYRRNNLDSAQYYLSWALDRIDASSLSDAKKVVLKGNILHDLANNNLQDAPTFLQYARQSDSLYQVADSDTDRARLWVDLGQFYINQGKHAEADSLFQLCLDYGNQNNDNDILIKAHQARGYLRAIKYYYYKKEEQSQAALADFQKCLSLQQEGRYRTYELLGWLYFTRWSYLDQSSDLDSTLLFYKSAIEEARKEGALNAMKSAAGSIAYLCGLEGNREKCDQVLDTMVTIFLGDNFSGVVDTITYHSKAAYQRTNQVEQREIVVSATRQRQNILLLGGGILIIAGLIFLLLYQRSQQKRLQARMEALRAQINPHFFSNSLNAIENLVNMDRKKEASKYIIHFSRLSRQILSRSREANTSLREELKLMKHFLELEKLRFPDKLNYEIIVDPDLDTGQIEVPSMVLQPYAENAIIHGIKPKTDNGLLRVEVKKEENKLVCIIEDNGIGRKKSAAIKAALAEQRKSMGMDITKERIQRMGKVKGQHLEIIDLMDDQGADLGTRVVLRLPLKFVKAKK